VLPALVEVVPDVEPDVVPEVEPDVEPGFEVVVGAGTVSGDSSWLFVSVESPARSRDDVRACTQSIFVVRMCLLIGAVVVPTSSPAWGRTR